MTTLPVVLCVPERQKYLATQLINYCRELDDLEVMCFVMTPAQDAAFMAKYPENRFHSLQAYGLHHAASSVSKFRRPFIWLEADAIPLAPGWAEKLAEEYFRSEKKFLLTSDSNPPFDLVGGVGVYPPETDWLVPYQFPKSSWDQWLLEAVPHLVGRTPLIQHSYGIYNQQGFAVEHRFPRDNKMLRKEAVIFHRDKFQDLIKNPVKWNFRTEMA